MFPALNHIQHLVDGIVLERDYRKQRTEKLFLNDMLINADRIDDGGGITQRFGITLASENYAVAIFLCKSRALVVRIPGY